MSQRHASRREFVAGVGLGIAGLSLVGEARAGGLFGRLLGRRRRNRSQDRWSSFKPSPVHGNSTDYGFVVDHHTYWGLPIPGFGAHPKPFSERDRATVSQLRVTNIRISTYSCWTGGDFTVFATRTPPLFHAYHHKTDEKFNGPPKEPSFKFARRAEDNVIETNKFGPREPLVGNGKSVLKELFDAEYDNRCCQWVNPPDKMLPIADFDVRANGLWQKAVDDGYFETRRGTWIDDGTYKKVGPLGALWIVLLQKDGNNTPLGRLGESYRLWHHLDHESLAPDGYKWSIRQTDDFHRFHVQIDLSGGLNKNNRSCPRESVRIAFELTWT